MRSHKLFRLSLLAAGLALPFASSASANVLISVDKTTQHMTVSVDGATRYVWPVSTGRPGYNTPNGTFHPLWMNAMHYSKEYEDAPMPDSIFFTKGYAIHGYTHTPFGIAAVSHGCVRLPRAAAAALFQLVKQNGTADTTIVIAGHAPRQQLMARRRTPMREATIPHYAQPGYERPPLGFAEGRYGAPVLAWQRAQLYDRGLPAYDNGPAYYQQPYDSSDVRFNPPD